MMCDQARMQRMYMFQSDMRARILDNQIKMLQLEQEKCLSDIKLIEHEYNKREIRINLLKKRLEDGGIFDESC